MKIKESLLKVQENIFLAPYTTFKIGGNAKYFFTAKTREDVVQAIKVAQECRLPFFILGSASNLLFPDDGFDGLIIKIEIGDYKLEADIINAEAGVMFSEIVNVAAKNSLSGLEWAIGIPGTVGGAIRGNAGAFNFSIGDRVEEVEVLEVAELSIKNYQLKDCKFSYRNSVFKASEDLIILSVKFRLKKGNKQEINSQMEKYRLHRIGRHPLKFPSAGSIFKNPPGMPAGVLIEKAGLKGKILGGAQISEKHCNFIINLGEAKARDVLALIELAKEKVKDKFNISLEEEVMILKK